MVSLASIALFNESDVEFNAIKPFCRFISFLMIVDIFLCCQTIFHVYCKAFFHLTTYMIINMSVSRLGMALVWLLYVKAPNWLKYKVGEKKVLILVGLVCFFISSLLTFTFGQGEARTRAALNLCLIHRSTMEVILIRI
jgi:hypothetical protein